MRPNRILTNCLMPGLCVIVSALFGSCEGRTDYRLDSVWIYTNASSSVISVLLGEGEYYSPDENFTLHPGETHTFEINAETTEEEVRATDYHTPYQYHGATITIDDRKYKITTKQWFNDLQNYVNKRLGGHKFQFTYVFTDENIAEFESSQ